MLKIILKSFVVCFLLSACTTFIPKNNLNQALFVTLYLPKIKIHDFAFLYSKANTLSLQVYKAAQPFFELKINERICVNRVCYEKRTFNEKFFNNSYYDELLEDILRAKPLWNAKNIQKNECGFIQKFDVYNIVYEVCDGKVNFVDEKSKVRIKWQKL
ncbi:hypothetical protein OQH60_06430 [Campylobacter sp. MIT 21-1685]|uniref:hypothetical protein n=1 Tax=unclassified Campylobacter TaxID=2593542 RepID=UPI00224B8E43|nr:MULTISPECIES: hypothetical protein [unclassified Campylobacter]MCX2683502.1 hypothetical protein [Campylobacter sp. MIT 21-1684]MCX2751783.1 hypothetical protein [Campylobacter sp. MIT 21-1682]MCX2807984.1 hypothetical protein [Campylobacter sp. MIT 21-1685]